VPESLSSDGYALYYYNFVEGANGGIRITDFVGVKESPAISPDGHATIRCYAPCQ
jgi:Tol biopolymer transport system component